MPAQIGGRTYSNGELVLGGGLILALINWFIPWWWGWSESCSGTGCGFLGAGINSSYGDNGFAEWYGVIGFIVLLVLIALFALRLFAPQTVPALPVPDWQIYLGGGVVLALVTILFLTIGGASATVGGYSASYGIRIGFFVGLILAIAVAVGGWLHKEDVQPATQPFTGFSGFNQQAPPPPPPPVQ